MEEIITNLLITGQENIQDNNKVAIAYVISFTFQETKLVIKKRYSELHHLYTKITKLPKEYSSLISNLPPFPGKAGIFGNTSSFLTQRKVSLEKFLQFLGSKTKFLQEKDIYEFFLSGKPSEKKNKWK